MAKSRKNVPIYLIDRSNPVCEVLAHKRLEVALAALGWCCRWLFYAPAIIALVYLVHSIMQGGGRSFR